MLQFPIIHKEETGINKWENKIVIATTKGKDEIVSVYD